MTRLLSSAELDTQLTQLPQWHQIEQRIQRQFQFKNFVEAIAFVNQLVQPAEAADHHPDIEISYNKVTVNLTTHDAGGLTQKDFDLAATFNTLLTE